MKTRSLFLAISLMGSLFCLTAQSPQGFNYQAIARDVANQPINGATLIVETGILSDTVVNNYLWKETHNVTTNQFGLFNLVIGTGTKTGGSVSTFNLINWTVAPLFIRTRVYYQSIWREMGAAKLWSVPYALVADRSSSLLGNPVQVNGGEVYILNNLGVGNNTPGGVKLSVMGDDLATEEALFEVKRKDGQTMFAVYNDGVDVFVPVITKKGAKGGFAIGGFDETKGVVHDYLIISPDSIRMYFDDSPAVKGTKGGFAIGGFDAAKAAGKEYLRVTDDSTRLYINNQTKGPKGGFAIGGFDATKAGVSNFLDLTPLNYFIGHQAGFKYTTGVNNAFIGYQSGYSVGAGSYNTFFGYQTGYLNYANYNVFIGYESGLSNTFGTKNSFIGYRAGRSNVSGSTNLFAGNDAGYLNNTGSSNVFLGNLAGHSNVVGSKNVFVGDSAGYGSTGSFSVHIGQGSGKVSTSGYNVFAGYWAGLKNTAGNYNVFLGHSAGISNTTGWSNNFIGQGAGYENTTGTNNIALGNDAGRLNKTTSGNIFIGRATGYSHTTGWGNTYIGHLVGESVDNGSNNTFLGTYSGNAKTAGSGNTLLGGYAGENSGTGNWNTYVGNHAGNYATGSYNTIIGGQAGYEALGSNNVLIGYFAGANETGSGKLYIDNSNTPEPLIGGDFTANRVGINRMPTTYTLEVGGTIWANGVAITAGSSTWSDERLKTNIQPIGNVLPKLLTLNGVSFDWKSEGYPDLNFPAGRQIGFIAQEIEKVFPELVTTGADGMKSVSYDRLTPLLLEAIRTQQQTIDDLKNSLDLQNRMILDNQEKVARLEALLNSVIER